MNAALHYDARPANPGWLGRAEAWLDQRGKPAWIVATILGFVVFWPVGLFLLAYMIWSNRMFGKSCHRRRHHGASQFRHGFHAMRPTGNAAFDAYKADTLRRLEEEQQGFEDFLQRLREARDKAEFDQFMDERSRAPRDSDADEKEDA